MNLENFQSTVHQSVIWISFPIGYICWLRLLNVPFTILPWLQFPQLEMGQNWSLQINLCLLILCFAAAGSKSLRLTKLSSNMWTLQQLFENVTWKFQVKLLTMLAWWHALVNYFQWHKLTWFLFILPVNTEFPKKTTFRKTSYNFIISGPFHLSKESSKKFSLWGFQNCPYISKLRDTHVFDFFPIC